MQPTIKKVIASIIRKDNKYLLAQRGKKDSFYGKWEFPGGKLEEGETEQECLSRELFEEFSIDAHIGAYVCNSFFEYEGKCIELRAYFVDSFSGDFILHEHLQIRWVLKEDLLSYDVPEPDKPIIDTLLKLV